MSEIDPSVNPGGAEATSSDLDAQLRAEVEAALGDMSLVEMEDAPPEGGGEGDETLRTGTVVSVQRDDILVDMGGNKFRFWLSGNFNVADMIVIQFPEAPTGKTSGSMTTSEAGIPWSWALSRIFLAT